ncbi:histidine kinase [Brevibacterium spongiae]|uniref:histidine kinase n=1 Tax=Brevibacterium spongiae TaxID=2909672 RepID=A0ABY5SRN2_9MICO|nr:histidine kinase [Brevibacterium spongiae]UVI35739.1 histidine kinase [Brevibacterium spongiae]
MSEKTPENPEDQEPQGTDPMETQTPEADTSSGEPAEASPIEASPVDESPEDSAPDSSPTESVREESISAEAIVNAPPTAEVEAATASQAGEFRTKPLDLEVPFATGSTRQHPRTPEQSPESSGSAPGQPPRQHPQAPTRQYAQAPTRAYDQAPRPTRAPKATAGPASPNNAAPRTYPAPAGTYGPAGQALYGPTGQPNPQPRYPQHPGQAHHPQPGMAMPHTGPNPGPNGAPHPNAGPHPNAAPYPNPNRVPNAGPIPGPRPPRRRKPRPEPVSYAPVTGSLPLDRDDVTEIPADGPITWPKRPTGFIGVANLVLSAVLAVIWAWVPLGLLFTGIGGIFALGLGVLALLAWILVQQGANIAERYRAELVYGDKIPVPKIESSTREPGFGRFLHNRWLQVKSGAFWRSTAHHYIKMLLGAIIVGGTLAGICGSLYGLFAAINPYGVNAFFVSSTIEGSARLGVAIGSVIVLASSLAILWFAPYLDRALDRALLAPARTVALQAEVTELDRARMAGIEAAAAERLRIERDLHDGAQPRLVALTMTLGMAKTKIDSDPERAKELVAEAHTEAKGIVNELRQLARGIHPAVLTDRGLDAAVSALAGRSAIPVDVDVRLEGRIGREAEAVSYFVVAECLTNIAKHSGATHAGVFIAPTEAGVQIVVTDNGHGGARVDRSGRHTGIAGLIDRVEAARGTLNLTSPAGGPTTVVVEVPCAS